MALKPDLNQTANLQNVLVYVSNDNFAQSYAVESQNGQANIHSSGYPHTNHAMASLAPTKNFSAKQQHIFTQGSYFENVVSQNGFPLSNITYQNGANLKGEVVSCDRPNTLKPDECDNRERYTEPYVTILGSEVPAQSVRCDSVRSETAESSCSSLSSADEGMIVVQNPSPEMVVYDPSVSVRPGGGGGVVLVAPPQTQGTTVIGINQPQFTTVPYGWKRLLNNGSVIYISPSNTALNSLDQVKEYLLTSGTCKCGLECHFKYDTVFNFDPKVIAKPWIMSPDTNTGDLTKLCNHKRKIMAMASLDCKPPDLEAGKMMRKDFELKKKRRKIGVPMSQSGISMSQILAQREKLALEQQQQQAFNKDIVTNAQQGWPSKNPSTSHGHLQSVPDGQQQNPLVRCHDSSGGNRMMNISPVVVAEGVQTSSQSNPPGPSIHIHSQQVLGPNGQIINLQDFPQQGQNQIIQGQNMFHAQQQHNRMFMNTQPTEPSGPGRPPKGSEIQHKVHQQMFVNQAMQQQQYELVDPNKINSRQFGFNGVRAQQPKFHWQHRMPNQQQQLNQMMHIQQQQQQQNVYERVPPLHQHTSPNPIWQEELRRKKVKVGRLVKRQYHSSMENCQIRQNQVPCPNIDVRQIPSETNRQVVISQMPQHNQSASSPSFMEDPSGYLAQQTALLNSTINRQTGTYTNLNQMASGEVPLPSNVSAKPPLSTRVQQQNINNMVRHKQLVDSSVMHLEQQQMFSQQHCQECISDSNSYAQQQKIKQVRCDSTPDTIEDPVTSSVYSEKLLNQTSPDSRPIQGGTVSTSNVSPMDSDPPTPNPAPTPPQMQPTPTGFSIQNQEGQIVQIVAQSRDEYMQQCQGHSKLDFSSSHPKVVTTMASGRTTGCNTITSVLAGRTNTATVSINAGNTAHTPPSSGSVVSNSNQAVSKSPLEMVQSVVSSIQVPPHSSPQILKHSPTGLPPGHILVSSNGQLIMASAAPGHANVMAPPPPPKVVTSPMPPVSVSPMVTSVTATMSQVIPAVAQQVLGQQTVLVNTLPTPFVIQPGVTMTMEGMTVGQNIQLPQIVTGNLIQQQMDGSEARRAPALLSPDTKKKGKKRKMPSQTVAGMLHIAAQQNSGGVVVNQQGFPQQIQMTHSPQGLTTTPVMQALTIVPSKTGGPPQIVMNGQATQQIITNSQPTQQINLLQPVGLINGTTGVVQNIPIQQFIVPNIGSSMVMNADGTATILQDTSNLGMQLQIQNVNGQNVLTPIQSNNVFNGGQNILATGPAGMVIRAPTSQGKIIQQQHSPGAQFLSPNGGQFVVNGAQFSGQLSPLVASVSPSQQVTFNTSPQQLRSNNQIQANQQEFIQVNGQMGQTLMVPCNPQVASSPSSNQQQNTTFVQQNTTIVQQQTTMVANQNFQQQEQQRQMNMEQQNFLLNTNDKGQMHALIVQQQQQQQHRNNSMQDDLHYRQSVSTQTAVNQNSQAVTCQTSTLSAGSPPDTTTLSPVAPVEQSPPTAADTTTHTGGSTDDGLSPAPSNCSATCSEINVPGRPGSRTMAMVHCVSSSEPDLLETTHSQSEHHDWRKVSHSASSIKEEYIAMKQEFTDVSSGQMHYAKKQQQHYGHLVYEDTSNMVAGIQFMDQKMKQEMLNAKHYGKLMHQKRNDVMLVMDSTLFGDEDGEADRETATDSGQSKHEFKVGDLVWGPTKGSSSWPGKIVHITTDLAQVKWFGCEKNLSKIKIGQLQTLTEGFESHHQAGKKARTSRKLNTQLEKAIQEAMAELDRGGSADKVSSSNAKKSTVRLRGGQR